MHDRLERGRAASRVRTVGRLAFFAGVPLLAALAFSVPESALAACGASHPAGVHSASTGGGVHTATSRTSSGASSGGGGGGTLGCANGSSAPAVHALSTASSGRVIEGGVHPAARTANHARTAATAKTTHASTAHLRGVKSPRA